MLLGQGGPAEEIRLEPSSPAGREPWQEPAAWQSRDPSLGREGGIDGWMERQSMVSLLPSGKGEAAPGTVGMIPCKPLGQFVMSSRPQCCFGDKPDRIC